ncbi:hypothetical protein ABIC65_000994 [Sphingomonas trueperi]|uniref:hypothetical protein n=1 Tax=Sphingomonas trueperi TaxID=53317 RepID=UPI003392B5C7
MAGIIKLDDRRDLYASNLGLGGALECIAHAVSDIDTRLARWLLDVAQRTGGLMGFDLRGLSAASRAAFWAGVDRAHAGVANWDQETCFSPAVGVLRLLYERRGVQGAASDDHVPEIDLDEIWFDGSIA